MAVTINPGKEVILNGAILTFSPLPVAGTIRLNILDAAELQHNGRIRNVIATTRPVSIDFQPGERFTINGAEASLRVLSKGISITVHTPSRLITRQHKAKRLLPDSPASRLHKAIWDLAVLPQVGPLASVKRRETIATAYAEAVAGFQDSGTDDHFLDTVDGLVRHGNLHMALTAFKKICPPASAGSSAAGLEPEE